MYDQSESFRGFMILIQTTSDSKKTLSKIGRLLLTEKLSTCIHVTDAGIESSYIWEDGITTEHEYQLTIKTDEKNRLDIVNLIKVHHNYDVPEIIEIKADILNNEYYKWFNRSLK